MNVNKLNTTNNYFLYLHFLQTRQNGYPHKGCSINVGDVYYCPAMLCLTCIWAAIQERPFLSTSAFRNISGSNIDLKSGSATVTSSDVTIIK